MNRTLLALALGIFSMTNPNLTGMDQQAAPALAPKVAAHLATIQKTSQPLQPAHEQAAAKLGAWIAANYKPGQPLEVIIICTGNSRRSMLGSVMGNAVAAFSGMPEVRFHSGGTTPSAFNKRTIASLKRAGVVIEPTGDKAPAGPAGGDNLKYKVRWSAEGATPTLEMVEFSKHYRDPANPQTGFAAVLVCTEADGACPTVMGASARIPAPFEDPKKFDDTPEEAARYDERRDSLAHFMLKAFETAKTELKLAN